MKNLKRLRAEGYPPKQRIAIAYSEARRALKEAGRRETAAMREDWREAIHEAFDKPSTKRKKPARKEAAKRTVKRAAAKRTAKKAAKKSSRKKAVSKRADKGQAARLLRGFGPPSGWSGAVAGILGPERRAMLKRAWNAMSPEERAKMKAEFKKRMRGDRVIGPKTPHRPSRHKGFWSVEASYPVKRSDSFDKYRAYDARISKAARPGKWWASDTGPLPFSSRTRRAVATRFASEEAALAGAKRVRATGIPGIRARAVYVP